MPGSATDANYEEWRRSQLVVISMLHGAVMVARKILRRGWGYKVVDM